MKKINRTPEEQEIMEKGLICDDKPLPNFKKKKKEKIPPFPDKDMANMYPLDVFLNPLKGHPLYKEEEEWNQNNIVTKFKNYLYIFITSGAVSK